MKLTIKHICIILLIIIFSILRFNCGSRPKKTIYEGFENVEESSKTNPKDSFYLEVNEVFSGNKALRIKNIDGWGYKTILNVGSLGIKDVSWIKYKGKFKKVSGSVQNTSVICEIRDSIGNRLDWLDEPLRFKLIERNKWTEVESRFSVEKYFKPKNSFVFFIWNKGSGEESIADDIEIKFYR